MAFWLRASRIPVLVAYIGSSGSGGAGTESGSQSTLGGVIDASTASRGGGGAGVAGPSTLGGTFDAGVRGGAGAGSGSQSTLGGVIDPTVVTAKAPAQEDASAGGGAPAEGTTQSLQQVRGCLHACVLPHASYT